MCLIIFYPILFYSSYCILPYQTQPTLSLCFWHRVYYLKLGIVPMYPIFYSIELDLVLVYFNSIRFCVISYFIRFFHSIQLQSIQCCAIPLCFFTFYPIFIHLHSVLLDPLWSLFLSTYSAHSVDEHSCPLNPMLFSSALFHVIFSLHPTPSYPIFSPIKSHPISPQPIPIPCLILLYTIIIS